LNKSRLTNIVFAGHLLFFALVIIGVIPRSLVPYETGLLALFLIVMPLEEGLVFFVRSIPLFIAIPLTAGYDNLNMWRIFSGIIFLKFIISDLEFLKNLKFIRSRIAKVLLILLGLAFLSLWNAEDPITGLKRIIYFINTALIGIVIAHYAVREEYIKRLIKNIVVPIIIVSVVGIIQVFSTYFIDIYQFMRLWGEEIQLRLFGTEWSYIAVNLGNTWFAYYGEQLSLRVFSLFPDSHSFPIFLLLGLPALFAWTIQKPLAKNGYWAMVRTRGLLATIWIPIALLMAILSGTRGIWAAGAGMVIWCSLIWLYFRYRADRESRNIFACLSSYLVIFFILFLVAFPIFSSPQFLLSKGDSSLFERRIRSIIDFGETSNSQRLAIWHDSLKSIARHPLKGIGIGNFPVVLDQDIRLARAGSSAHNLYLHIAAEMGIFALLAAIYFLWLALKRVLNHFIKSTGTFFRAYYGGLLITLPWILAYSLTDVALFDERALLLFVVTLGIIFSND